MYFKRGVDDGHTGRELVKPLIIKDELLDMSNKLHTLQCRRLRASAYADFDIPRRGVLNNGQAQFIFPGNTIILMD
jgi:hypothetical protein